MNLISDDGYSDNKTRGFFIELISIENTSGLIDRTFITAEQMSIL